MFGLPEKSFIILDMALLEAKVLGEVWQQTSVIYARRTPQGLEISLMGMGSIGVESVVREFGMASDELSDNYSRLGANKWVIPFFDDKAEAKAQLSLAA